MIPLAVPNLTGNESRYLQECIDSTYVSSVGPFVQRFEKLIAKSADVNHVVCTPSGTTGLHLALRALDVNRDDLVILPSFTFIASANAIFHCGATPWLMDISTESWGLDPNILCESLDRDTEQRDGNCIHKATGRRVTAVIPVHVLGQPADMDPIVEIARKYSLCIVADAAAALGACYKDKLVGTLGADLVVFSFNGNKTITAGGGGAVCGNDKDLMQHVRHLATTARKGDDYDHDEIGFNYRITNLEAAIGCAQIERLDEFIAIKRHIRKKYEAEFLDLPGVTAFPTPGWSKSADWISALIIDPEVCGPVSDIRIQLREQGIDARPFWKPIHLQVPYHSAPRTSMNICEKIWSRILTLPCSTGLTEEQQAIVIAAVHKVLKQ